MVKRQLSERFPNEFRQPQQGSCFIFVWFVSYLYVRFDVADRRNTYHIGYCILLHGLFRHKYGHVGYDRRLLDRVFQARPFSRKLSIGQSRLDQRGICNSRSALDSIVDHNTYTVWPRQYMDHDRGRLDENDYNSFAAVYFPGYGSFFGSNA